MIEKIDLDFSTNYFSEDIEEITSQFKEEDKLAHLGRGDISLKDQMKIAQGTVLEAKKSLSLNENIDPKAQRYLAENSKTCHVWLSTNPSVEQDVLLTLASSDNVEVLINLLNRSFVSNDVQKAIMKSVSKLENYKKYKVYWALSKCPTLDNSVLKELIKSTDITLLSNLSQRESLPHCYYYLKLLFDEESVIPDKFAEIVLKQNNQTKFRFLAKNKSISVSIQKSLFEIGNGKVLEELIQNPSFDKDLQIRFVKNYPDINETIKQEIESYSDDIYEDRKKYRPRDKRDREEIKTRYIRDNKKELFSLLRQNPAYNEEVREIINPYLCIKNHA